MKTRIYAAPAVKGLNTNHSEFNPYSVGIEFGRQNLTSVAIRSQRCKGKHIYNGGRPITYRYSNESERAE